MVTCSWAYTGNSQQKEIDLLTQAEITAEYYELQSEYYHEKYYGNVSRVKAILKYEIDLLQNTFRNLDVMEIACGTGFWTETVAITAESVWATDVNSSLIDVARRRLSHLDNVTFGVSDAFSTLGRSRKYDGAFCVLFWCHIPVQRIEDFLSALCASLKPGSPVIFVDQLEDSDVKNHTTDRYRNRIAKRELNGKQFSVVKNVPSEAQLHHCLKNYAKAGSIRYSSRPDGSGMWSALWNTAGMEAP
jgi:demethylmenaquinone methyltransferase/2-methoxy-6-polyprenyl-1,4-benzoquinol methylase